MLGTSHDLLQPQPAPQVFLNDGQGHFTEGEPIVDCAGAYSIVTGDFDGNGSTDFICNYEYAVPPNGSLMIGSKLMLNLPDTTPPMVAIDQFSPQNNPTHDTTIYFTVTFSEPVTDFAAGDVNIRGTAGATTATVTAADPYGMQYDVAISGMTGDGTVIANIPAGAVHDFSGNANVASTSTDNSVVYDTTSPTVTIDQAAGQADPTHASTINFTVVFSEAVDDFTADDVTLYGIPAVYEHPAAASADGVGATSSLTAVVTGSGTTYNVAVSGMTGVEQVIASIGAGMAHDAAGNGNVASTSTDNVVTYETPPIIASVVVAEAAAPKNNILESNESLRITWAVSTHYGVTSQTMTVDGKAIAPINGPYGKLLYGFLGTVYYSCPIGTWAAGNHTYTITTSDSQGVSSTSTGSFDVVAPVPPAITRVVVAEAAAPGSGLLESNRTLVITFAATGSSRIVSQSVQIDDGSMAPIHGPYGGLYYSCSIGTRAAGTHTYTITSTDATGGQSTSTGSFTVVSPDPPTISSVVVGEAAAPRNGILETNENLVITWAATSSLGVGSQHVSVDGYGNRADQGPFGGRVLFLPDWNLGGGRPYVYDYIDRRDGRPIDQHRHVHGRGARGVRADHLRRRRGRGFHAQERHLGVERLA